MDMLTISDFKKYPVIAVQDEKDFDSHLYLDMKKGRKEYLDGKCVESKNHNELLSLTIYYQKSDYANYTFFGLPFAERPY